MPVELIGYLRANLESEIHPPGAGPVIDTEYLLKLARAQERSGFDRVLVASSSSTPDAVQLAAHVAAQTERLGFMIAHRPGFVAPTMAARLFATLDQLSRGRVAVHTISGASDAEQRRDGDYLDKAERYARSREFLQILKQAWTSTTPFSHEGEFYRFEDFLSTVLPFQKPRIPIFFGGSSPEAIATGAAEADVYMLYGLPRPETTRELDKIRAACQEVGRTGPLRVGVTFRPILADTDELAWRRAARIRDQVVANARVGFKSATRRANSDGAAPSGQQLAAESTMRDGAVWMELATMTGGAGNAGALVGAPETVVDTLVGYVSLGVTTFLFRGYDPLDDAVDFGRELIPRLRAAVAEREKAGVA
jgi:alkanesulfonate monooxygenase